MAVSSIEFISATPLAEKELSDEQLQQLVNRFEEIQKAADILQLNKALNHTTQLTVEQFVQLYQQTKDLINNELIPFCQGPKGIDILDETYPSRELTELCNKADVLYSTLKNIHDNQNQLHQTIQKRLEVCQTYLISEKFHAQLKQKFARQSVCNESPQNTIIKQQCKSTLQQLNQFKIANLNQTFLSSLIFTNCCLQFLEYQLDIIKVRCECTQNFIQQKVYKIPLDKIAIEEQANLLCLNNRIDPVLEYLEKTLKKYPNHSQLIVIRQAVFACRQIVIEAVNIHFPTLKLQVKFSWPIEAVQNALQERKKRVSMANSLLALSELNSPPKEKLFKRRNLTGDLITTFGPDLCQGIKKHYKS